MPTYNAQDLSCSLCLTNSIPIMEAKLPTSKKPALSSITSKCHLQYNIGKYRLRLRRLLIISPTDTYTSTKQSSLFNSHSTQLYKDLTIPCELFSLGYQMFQILIFSSKVQSSFFKKITLILLIVIIPLLAFTFFIQTFSKIQSFFYVMTPTLKFKTLYNEREHCSFKQLHSGICDRKFIFYLFP